MRTWNVVIGIVVVAVCASCDGVRQVAGTIGELQQVQQTVSKAVGTVNAPLKDLPVDQKKAKALEVAQLAYRSYPQTAKLDQVSVAFVDQRSYLGVINYTDTSDAFSFMASELSNVKSIVGERSDH